MDSDWGQVIRRWARRLLCAWILGGLAVTAVLALPSASYAQSAGAGQVTVLIGEATVIRQGRTRATRVGAWLMAGDVVQTGEQSRLKIIFTDNSLISLGPLTKFEVTRQEVSPRERSRFSSFRLWEGRIRAVVSSWFGDNHQFEIRTPTAVAGVRGTNFMAEADGETSTIATTDGTVEVTTDGPGAAQDCAPVDVEEGTYTVVRRGTCPTAPQGLQPEMLQWDRDLHLEPPLKRKRREPSDPGDLSPPGPWKGPPTPPRGGRPGGSGVFQGPGPGGNTTPPVGLLPGKPLTNVKIVIKGGP